MIDEEGRLRRIDYGDRIFFNSVTGIAGAIYPIGTAAMPSSVIADVITLCATYNLIDIDVHGILQLLADMEHYCFHGHCHESIADVLDLNGQDVDNSRFDNCLITGAQGGAELATFMDCILYNMTGFRGMAEGCALFTPLAVSVGISDFDHCTSLHGTLTVTVGAPARLSFKKFSGGMILTLQTGGVAFVRGIEGYLEVDEMTGGTLDIYADAADIQINADCTGGTINIYGNARVVDNSVGAIVTNHSIDQRAENIDDKVSGILVQVPFYRATQTVKNASVTLFALDALGGTIREVYIDFYLVADALATFTPTWHKTRPGDLATFIEEADPPLAVIVNPGAARHYSYKLGEIAQGLQGEFRLAQDNLGNANNAVDAICVAVMVP